MKVGIFLAYRPNVKLNTEGLGRYIALLIRGLVNEGCEITIATPKWSMESLKELFEDCNVDEENITYMTTENMPIALSIYYFLQKKFRFRKRKSKEKWMTKVVMNSIENILSILLSTSYALIFLALIIAICILSIPIIIIGVLYYITKWIYRHINNTKVSGLNVFNKIKNKIFNKIRPLEVFHNRVYSMEISKILRLINKSSNIDIWYSPTMFWPEFNEIKNVKAICSPDLVLLDFPTQFSTISSSLNIVEFCSETIDKGKYFITYSNFIKNSLLIGKFDKKDKNIRVIPHGCNNLIEYIDVRSNLNYSYTDDKTNTDFARVKIQDYALRNFTTPYLSECDFTDIKYLFYASQNRFYKNILNLIKAYEYLLRKKYINIKLILTCDFSHFKEVNDYIYQNRLQYDIISFKNCSAQTLAALYHCAELVVNPTLYEGGFPFTFVEGMSVGVPSIMSRIPQVEEAVNGYDLDDMLFDPFDYKDIAYKIMYGLDNRQLLLKRQYKLYKDWSQRTWQVAAREYKQAFEFFIGQHNEEKNKDIRKKGKVKK